MDKTILGLLIATGLVLAGIFFVARSSGQATTPVGDEQPIQGQEHIADGSFNHPAYSSNPPTSGWHWPAPADWGVYVQEEPDERLVHNLEHGGVNVFYRPDLSQEDKNNLETIVLAYPIRVILAPRSANESLISLASWGRLKKLDRFDESEIRDFIQKNRNHGPETFPDSVELKRAKTTKR